MVVTSPLAITGRRLRTLFLSCLLNVRNKRLFCFTFNCLNVAAGRPSPVSFATDGTEIVATCSRTGRSVVFRRIRRANLYFRGVERRLKYLFDDYRLSNIEFRNGDVVIDCGANVGELGLYLRDRPVKYVAIEPSKPEFLALQKNLGSQAVALNVALWKECTTLTFFDGNDEGDSSVFEIENASPERTTVEAITLEKVFSEYKFDRVRLLKLEAEGAEPEILEGAKSIIHQIDYIAVDCGFERGLKKESTFREVLGTMQNNSFSLVDFNYSRFAFLFVNARTADK